MSFSAVILNFILRIFYNIHKKNNFDIFNVAMIFHIFFDVDLHKIRWDRQVRALFLQPTLSINTVQFYVNEVAIVPPT